MNTLTAAFEILQQLDNAHLIANSETTAIVVSNSDGTFTHLTIEVKDTFLPLSEVAEPEDVIRTAHLASDTNNGSYMVTETLAGGDPDRASYTCECKDFTIRGNPMCKHIQRAINYGYFDKS